MKNLVIVESPAKAKTIEKYLGKDYVVKSSKGHIRDLPKKKLSIDVENNFTPTYEITPDKYAVVKELRQLAKNSQEIILASDEDREGEAIAWHLCYALDLDPTKTKRIVFHEITKPAIENAIANPRTVNLNLVDAQQARRVLDRLVGYELSPVLWRKVQAGLSAGRVQSVAVRLIVDREREIRNFDNLSVYKVIGSFHCRDMSIDAEADKKFDDQTAARQFLTDLIGASFKVSDISKKPGKLSPSAPFTTSTLQQEASRKLGYSVKYTMQLAQKLYENGHITYMRTDSTNLSSMAINNIADYIKTSYGANYLSSRNYATKNQSAQEAHEAIRPTNISQSSAGQDEAQKKLYNLIWKRTVASQMTAAQIEKTVLTIINNQRSEKFLAKGQILVFDGFIKVYGGGKDDAILPPLQKDDLLDLEEIRAIETYSRPPARYSEASLVRKLEENGIGRPSTYAPTISTIQARGYVQKTDLEAKMRTINILTLKDDQISQTTEEERYGADRGKLLPTAVAEITTDFLVKYFTDIVDFDFTAKMEAGFDEIADGKQAWTKLIDKFWKEFIPKIEGSKNVDRSETVQARLLGHHPKDGKPIYARFGRFGPMLQKGENTDEEKPAFAPLPEGTELATVNYEQALPMFSLPRLVGQTKDGQDIKANIGRFGPYVQFGSTFVSIRGHDPFSIDLETANELIAAKKAADAAKYINQWGEIQIINGRFGPYITDGQKNVKIAKDQDPKAITEAEAKRLIAEAPEKKAYGGRFKAKSSAKVSKKTPKRTTKKKVSTKKVKKTTRKKTS